MLPHPYNFQSLIDDYGNEIVEYSSASFQAYIISTSTYGGFSRAATDDFAINP